MYSLSWYGNKQIFVFIQEHSLIETVNYSSEKKVRYNSLKVPWAEYITYLEHRAIISMDAGGGVQHTLVFDG